MSVFQAYSTYYDLLYQDKDYVAEANYVMDRLTNSLGKKPKSILDLGCGTGKHAETFAKHGIDVWGVDLSATMIEQAKQRLPNANFTQGDVRFVQIDQTFDSVISLFHVASYQTGNDDIKSYLKTAAYHLRAGGIFLFDFWYGPAVYSQQPTVRVKRMQNNQAQILRTAEPVHRENDCVVEVNYEVIVEEIATKQTQHIREQHLMRYFFLPELTHLLESAGFEANTIKFEEWLTSNAPSGNTWGVTAIARKL